MTRNNSFSPSAQMIADFAISTAHKKANMCNRHCEGSPRAWLTSKGRFKIAMFMIHSLSLTHTHTKTNEFADHLLPVHPNRYLNTFIVTFKACAQQQTQNGKFRFSAKDRHVDPSWRFNPTSNVRIPNRNYQN